ncbi:importin-11-like [Daphnia carinata]|uniref:importin-11-like n=1 Tax=Daphnia carinata TaxID=120202 RepID=UPI00257B7B52|nr:importin-11-like [Daphnia carinata]XP_059353130.1 importin-11-like [Daphnia carinata]XP_059353131.1 importin-11-like [Daphnia carinata]
MANIQLSINPSVKAAIFEALQAGVSDNTALIKEAEIYLKTVESTPVFHLTLVEIITNTSIDVKVRWLASVYFKNGIDRYWRKNTSNSIPEGEKTILRQKLISHINEPVLQVATQLAIIISKIARYDYPKEWPELLPSLLHLVRTEDDLVQQRALLYLHHVTKSLASKRLAGDRRAFQDLSSEMYSYVYALYSHLSQTLMQQMETSNVETVGATMEKALLCLRVMRKLTVHGFKTPHQTNSVMEFVQSLYERIKNLLQYRQVILSNESLLALCEKYLVVHCKVLRDLLDFHPFSFVPFIRMTVEFVLHYLFQPENQILLFDSFVVQCLNLIKGIVLCAEYRPAKVIEDTKEPATLEAYRIKSEVFTPDSLSLMCRQLIENYLLLSQEDLHLWETNPEEFAAEEGGEAWKYSLRPCTGCLFLSLFHEYQSILSPVLISMLNESMGLIPPNDMSRIIKKDALYNAIGLAAFELFDEVDFDRWFSQVLLQELRVKESNYRILRRRVVWLLGRWIGVKLSVDLRPLIYETVLGLMEPGEDLVIRLSSAVTLRSALDDFEFNAEQFLPYLERSFSLLFTLLKETEECETKMNVLNVMSLLIELLGNQMKPFLGTLLQLLPALWDASDEHNLLRCAIISTLVHVVKGVGSNTEDLLHCLLPVVAYSTDSEQPAHVYLLDDALALWQAMIESLSQANPQVLQLLNNMPQLLELGSENLIICCDILKAYIYLCPDEFLAMYGSRIVNVLMEQIVDMRPEGEMRVMSVIESMLVNRPETAASIVSPILPFVVSSLLDGSSTALIITSFFSAISRVVLASKDIFFQVIAEVARREKQTPEFVLDKFMTLWIDKMSSVFALEKKKLLAIALASLLTCQSDIILDKICGIFMRICETINDILPPTDSGEEIDRLVYAPGHVQADEGEEEVDNEHLKRYISTRRSVDPVFTLPLPTYFRNQITQLEAQVGSARFQDMTQTVDNETLEMMRNFLSPQPRNNQL